MPDRYGQYRLALDTPENRHVGRQTAVFRGHDERPANPAAAAVAIKTVSPLLREPEAALRCGLRLLAQKEVQAKVAQHSARWLPVLAAVTGADNTPYAVEPWRPGTLKEQILAGPSSAHFTHGVMTGVLQGLVDIRTALGRGHGNLKSTNILLDSVGSAYMNDPAVLAAETVTPESEDLQALARLLFHWVQRHEYGPGMQPDAQSWSRAFGKAAAAWQQLFLDLDSARIATAREALTRADALRPQRRTSPRLLIGSGALALVVLLVGLLCWWSADRRALQAKLKRIHGARPWVNELLTMERLLFPTDDAAVVKWQDAAGFDPGFKARLDWLRNQRDLLDTDPAKDPEPEKIRLACDAIAELEAFFALRDSGGGPATPGSAAPWALLQELRQEASRNDSVFPQQTRDAILRATQVSESSKTVDTGPAQELCSRIITLLLAAHARPAYRQARDCAEAVWKDVLSPADSKTKTILYDRLPALIDGDLGKEPGNEPGSMRETVANIRGRGSYNLKYVKAVRDSLETGTRGGVRSELDRLSRFIASKKRALAKEEARKEGNRLKTVEDGVARMELRSLPEFVDAWCVHVEEKMLVHEVPEEWLAGLTKLDVVSPPVQNLWAKRLVYARQVLEDRKGQGTGALADDDVYLMMRAEFARLRSFLTALDRDGLLQATPSPLPAAGDDGLWATRVAENYLRVVVLDACCPEPEPGNAPKLLRPDVTTLSEFLTRSDADAKLQKAREHATSFCADMRVLHEQVLKQGGLLTEPPAAALWERWRNHPILAGLADPQPPAVALLRTLDDIGKQDAKAVWKALAEVKAEPETLGCWALVRAGGERLATLDDWPGVEGGLGELEQRQVDWTGKGMPDACGDSLRWAQLTGTLRLAAAQLVGDDGEAVRRWLQPGNLTRPGNREDLNACLESAAGVLTATSPQALALYDWAYSAQELTDQTPPSECKTRLDACLTVVKGSRKLVPDPRDLGPLEDWLRKGQQDAQGLVSSATAGDTREPDDPRQRLQVLLKEFKDGLKKLTELHPVQGNVAAIKEQRDALEKLMEEAIGCLAKIGRSTPVTPAVKVKPPAANGLPVAQDDALAVVDFPFFDSDKAPGIDPIHVRYLLDNDTDPDGDRLFVVKDSVTGTQFCTATLDPNGERVNIEVRIPAWLDQGAGLGPVLCTFRYTISDGRGGTSQATAGFLTWLPKCLFDGSRVTRKPERRTRAIDDIVAARRGLPDKLWREIVTKWSTSIHASAITAAARLRWPGLRIDNGTERKQVLAFVAAIDAIP